MTPKISVVTICRNEIKGIQRTLDSVFNQTFKNFEYLVIDGNSSDGTKELIQGQAEKISYFISEADSGIYNAMNKALKKAQGEYVIFINGGDALASNDVFEKIFNIPENSADIIYGDMWIEQDNKATLGRSPDKVTLGHLFYSTLWHPVSFIKLSLFKNFGHYDETLKIAADYDFFLNAIGKNKVTTQKVNFPVSRFNTKGVGSDPVNRDKVEFERNLSQKKYFSEETISLGKEYKELMEKISQQNSTFCMRVLNFIKNKFS